jgi:polysaccharide biosynthesis transport protein
MQKALDARQQFAIPASPSGIGDDEIDILEIVRTLWRGKFLIVLCALIVMLLGAYYAFQIAVPTYRSTAKMALQIRQETVVDLDSVLSGVSSDQSSMNTEMEVIRSRELLSRLVDQLDLMSDPEFNPDLRPVSDLSPERILDFVRRYVPLPQRPAELVDADEPRNTAIANVRDATSTIIGRDSYVFSITATTWDPVKSMQMANTLAHIYRDDQIAVKVEATENAARWLSGRVSELQTELEGKQQEITELRTSSALVSAEALEALNAQSVDLQTQLQGARSELARQSEQRDAMRAVTGAPNAAKVAAANDIQLESIDAAIQRGDATAQVRFDRRFEQLLAQVATDSERVAALVSELQIQADQLGRQFEQQSVELLKLQQLERETEATRVLYETFLTRLKETTVQEGVHQADSRILSEATRGEVVAPRKGRIIAVSLILGLMIGSAIVLLREFLQNTYRTAEDLERTTGQTVLGQIPKFPVRGRPETIAYLMSKPTSAAAESVRNLRTSLLLSNVDNPPRIIMCTSSIPGEGKTTQSIALSLNLASLKKKVILIEGDIRRRTFTAYFPGAADNGGLLSVISGKTPLEQAVYHHPEMKVDILMGERSSINAADVFSSEAFQHLIEKLRDTYDYVIIDTPPVLVVPDARVIGQHVDAITYSVNWDRTTKSQVSEGLKQFQSVNLRVTGLVLSQIDPRGMKRYGYGGKYGAYSRYGKGYYDA